MKMTLILPMCVAAALGAAHAQATGPTSRWSVGASVGAQSVPDAFGSRCGKPASDDLALNAGGMVVFRPRAWLNLEASTRYTNVPQLFGCDLVIPAPIPLGNGVFEARSGPDYDRDVPEDQFVDSRLRVGVATPPSWSSEFVRLMLGGGVIWGKQSVPVGSIAAAFGTRGERHRFYVELEESASRVRALETINRFRQDSTGETPISSTHVYSIAHPHWTEFRFVFEQTIR
ncbi:MAG TPA: hypothetical protein VN706_10470 [Gemmatimonadaceae bacterium]|nr:hypothetical protein [Gemmatimonadaceae bacterium]